MTRAMTYYTSAINEVSEYLHTITEPGWIPLNEYESTYKKARALKKFWGDVSWDVIERETKEGWITVMRSDAHFKVYYKLRMEADRLEVLLR